MISRNEAMGIVERTHKNLVYMRNARKNGADIHEVTHLFNSLLGLIVIPWERELNPHFPDEARGRVVIGKKATHVSRIREHHSG